jgi:hypothetical protein
MAYNKLKGGDYKASNNKGNKLGKDNSNKIVEYNNKSNTLIKDNNRFKPLLKKEVYNNNNIYKDLIKAKSKVNSDFTLTFNKKGKGRDKGKGKGKGKGKIKVKAIS